MIIPTVSDKDDDNTKDNKAILLPNHQGNVQVGTQLIELYTNDKKKREVHDTSSSRSGGE